MVYLLSQASSKPAKDADQESLYAALAIRELAPQVPLYGEVALPENRNKHLLRAGVNEILVHGQLTSMVLGLMGANPSMWTLLQEMLGMRGNNHLEFKSLSGEGKGARLGRAHGPVQKGRTAAPGTVPVVQAALPGRRAGRRLGPGPVHPGAVRILGPGNAHRRHRTARSGQTRRTSEKLDQYDAVLFLKPGAAR